MKSFVAWPAIANGSLRCGERKALRIAPPEGVFRGDPSLFAACSLDLSKRAQQAAGNKYLSGAYARSRVRVVSRHRSPSTARRTSRTDRLGSPRHMRAWPESELAPSHPSRPDCERKYGFDARRRGPAPRDRPGGQGTSRRITEIVRAVGIERPASCFLTELIVVIVRAVRAARAVVTVAISRAASPPPPRSSFATLCSSSTCSSVRR